MKLNSSTLKDITSNCKCLPSCLSYKSPEKQNKTPHISNDYQLLRWNAFSCCFCSIYETTIAEGQHWDQGVFSYSWITAGGASSFDSQGPTAWIGYSFSPNLEARKKITHGLQISLFWPLKIRLVDMCNKPEGPWLVNKCFYYFIGVGNGNPLQ